MAHRNFKIYTVLILFFHVIVADEYHPFNRLSIEAQAESTNGDEQSSEYWNQKAQDWLAQKIGSLNAAETKVSKAKNIILFLGDGMSVHTLTGARTLMGDSSLQLSFDNFTHVGLSRTYCVDSQVADSACTATAYLGGVKGNFATIGVNANVLRKDCNTGIKPENRVESIAKWAQDAKKSAGLVTTARVTHASPAGVYAHVAERNWEANSNVLKDGCNDILVSDIARQLIEGDVGSKLKVIMGGGRKNFRSTHVNDEEGYPNVRTDGRDLINEWKENKKEKNAQYVWSRKGLNILDLSKTDYLLGLFSNSHCPYNGDLVRQHTSGVYPTLTEMTEAAINVLKRDENGFFLFVEGAKIDLAHHDAKVHKSLEDTIEFSRAIQRAREMTSLEDTLIVVTSDHSHTMTVNGYPKRGDTITGLRDKNTEDGIAHTILSYANGPGYRDATSNVKNVQLDLVDLEKDLKNADFQYPSTVPLNSETHGGDDVGVFASGPLAHYFSGNYEQSHIPALMARAANIGPYANI